MLQNTSLLSYAHSITIALGFSCYSLHHFFFNLRIEGFSSEILMHDFFYRSPFENQQEWHLFSIQVTRESLKHHLSSGVE